MTKTEILDYLKKHKNDYANDGVVLLGLFGSFARDEADENSDIDILIETKESFLKKFVGFRGYTKLNEIKETISKDLQKDIDLVDKVGLIQHNNDYIIEKAIYV
jgi:predicted nucleotidyltransferase